MRRKCGYELAALHVNHGLSPNADAWQAFCRETCLSYQIPFTARSVDVPRDSGLGIEAAARTARYDVLLAEAVDMVVLAHHQDDQAETLLLQLLRGAGVKGMASMPLQTDAAGTMPAILRPLLDIPRSVIELYAQENRLRWVDDESNLDLAYDRNFLRHHVFPEVEKRFPACRVTLARSASHLAEAAELLDEVAREDAVRWIRQGRLNIEALRTMSGPRSRNLLRHWLSTYLREFPSTRRLCEIHRQLLHAGAEAMIGIAVGDGQVRRYRNEAWFDRSVSQSVRNDLEWRGERVMQLDGGSLLFRQEMGAGIALARLADDALRIRSRSGGETLRLHPARPARTIKNLFQESGVPAWQRSGFPLIYWSDQLIAMPGIGVACEWQAGTNEAGLVIEWRTE
jgi:tRNA(Ile)-lysidine synthase